MEEMIRGMGSAAVAFSGGVDSSVILKIARDILGEKTVGVTFRSCFVSGREIEEACAVAKFIGVEHIILDIDVLDDENITSNTSERCYYCNRKKFGELVALAGKRNLRYILDGTNYSDTADYRPGGKARKELGIVSPLRDAEIVKSEVVEIAGFLGLPNYNKPQESCLASRIPYGTATTYEKLKRIEQSEDFLKRLGFREVRARDHGDIARIEVCKDQFGLLLEHENREMITGAFKDSGYKYVTFDLEGYNTGSMNKLLEGEGYGEGKS
ncbi:MAG: ATP-dependent sacrificial sulfur transferase LarE [Chloroflexi bacterium]|nr:ATP-dependent sacrificial sulfur transferase LarE [Chloroflexota bacterium]